MQLIQAGLIYGVDVLQLWEESSMMTVRFHYSFQILNHRHKTNILMGSAIHFTEVTAVL